jgi:hypothetical protein
MTSRQILRFDGASIRADQIASVTHDKEGTKIVLTSGKSHIVKTPLSQVELAWRRATEGERR